MKPIIIFGAKIQGKDCPWCIRARALVERRGLKHVYFDTTSDPEKRAELNERLPDHKTVPQIFVGPVHIGGFTDLAAADRTGRLQQLIAGE